ncbi:MAG: mutA, partial [Ilumatobacteraceae bacterium]|nr:mutA [Ilumatobacteraceae bacterium]
MPAGETLLTRVDSVVNAGTTEPPTDLVLGGEFAAGTLAEWRAAVDKVIARGGKDLTPEQLAERFQLELVTETVDGLVIQPLYTDLGNAPEPGVAGAAPFTRGSTTLAHRRYGWEVRQRVLATADPEAVNVLVLEELERGSTSVLLDLSALASVDVDYLDAALSGVQLDLAPIALTGALDGIAAAGALLALHRRRGVSSTGSGGCLGLDPIGAWAARGGGDIAADLAAATALAEQCIAEAPAVRSFAVDARVVHEAGGGDVEELAYAAAAGLQLARSLVAAGVSIDNAMSQLEFRFAATPDQFLTIAKLRAARRVWQRIAEVSGASSEAQHQQQHAISSSAASSRYDIWVNMLRGTVECFGAGVGGADAVTITPHDELVSPGGSELGRRMSRNTQVVLIEESNLSKVIDMAGGSWYVEQLTDQLAHAAWSLMQEIERAGGVVDAIRADLLQAHIDTTRAKRDTAIAKRKMALTGVTEFPNIAEPVPPAATATAAAAAAAAAAATDDATTAGTEFAPLRASRYADRIEQQRARADQLAAGATGRPTVFLAALGPTSVNAARVTFAKNLFEVGGIEGIVGESTTDPAAIRTAYEQSGASLVCICSSDTIYAELAVTVANEL